MTTMHEWASQGLDQQQGQQFAQDITGIPAIKIFAAVLPRWCANNNTGVVLQISSDPNLNGAGIELAFSRQTLPVSAANELLELIQQQTHLAELQLVIEKMRGLGVDASIINVLVDEADKLAQQLHASL